MVICARIEAIRGHLPSDLIEVIMLAFIGSFAAVSRPMERSGLLEGVFIFVNLVRFQRWLCLHIESLRAHESLVDFRRRLLLVQLRQRSQPFYLVEMAAVRVVVEGRILIVAHSVVILLLLQPMLRLCLLPGPNLKLCFDCSGLLLERVLGSAVQLLWRHFLLIPLAE